MSKNIVKENDLRYINILNFIIDWGNDRKLTKKTIDSYFREWDRLEKFCSLINKDIGYLNIDDMGLYKLILERSGYIKRTIKKKYGQAMFIAILHMKYEQYERIIYMNKENKKKIKEFKKIARYQKELQQEEIKLLEELKEKDPLAYREWIKEYD